MEEARECLGTADGNQSSLDTLMSFIKRSQGLGELRMKVYTPNDGDNYETMLYPDSEMEEFGRRSSIHFSKILLFAKNKPKPL
jgi:proline iminopeptidase